MRITEIIKKGTSTNDREVESAYDAIFADDTMREELEQLDLTACEYIDLLAAREQQAH